MNTQRSYLPLPETAKLILGWSFWTCLLLGFFVVSTKATTIAGETVIFQDLTDTLSISQAGGNRFNCPPNGEHTACVIEAPGGATFASSTLINNGGLYILEPGATPTDTLSDEILFFAPPITTGVNIAFTSDPDPSFGTGNCANPKEHCVTEDGTVQTAGTITWAPSATGPTTNCSDPTTTCIVDTIKFQSDLEPEPGTIVLFGSGLISVLGFMRRRKQTG